MKRILADHPKLPTALVCSNDIIASGCLKALAEVGVRVPEDVSVVGFDNLPLAAITDPPPDYNSGFEIANWQNGGAVARLQNPRRGRCACGKGTHRRDAHRAQ